MPSNNTRYARNKGYSDMKQLGRDGGRSKNYGQRTGKCTNTARVNKHAANPPTSNNAHWVDSDWERKRRKGLV